MQKILISFILVLFIAGIIAPQQAKAAVPTFDVGLNPLLYITQPTIVEELAILNSMQASQHLKEVGVPPWPPVPTSFLPEDNLDAFGWIIAKLAMATLMEQIINWVRTGNILDGGPLFVQNWGQYLLNARDKASDLFGRELIKSNICEPFAAPIKEALTNNIIGPGLPLNRQVACSFEDTIGSMQAFFDDFEKGGGWAAWESLTQRPENNPYIVYLTGLINLDNRQAQGVAENEMEALSSLGMLADEECEDVEIETDDGPVTYSECTTVTPGKSVETELSKVLETNLENLNLADELDEVLQAILGNILQNIIFEAGGILRGILNPVPPPPPPPAPPTSAVCGDKICAVNENPLSCPSDCSALSAQTGFAITSPANNSSVRNSVTVSASGSSVAGVASVQFTIDGNNIGSPVTGTGNYTATLDLSAISEGAHVITAVALDSSGNKIDETPPINITVDRTAPTLSGLRTEKNPANLGGNTDIFVDASDGGPKTGLTVEFLVNSTVIGRAELQNNGFFRLRNWNTRTFSNGTYSLTARATDAAGNVGTSPPMTIVINN